VVGFVIVLLVLIAGVVGAIGVYARGSYFVGVDQAQITIYKGRPGGLLWFRPTIVEHTGVPSTSVLATRVSDLQSGKEEASLSEARKYVRNLQEEAIAHQVGPSTTTTTPKTPPSQP
jgi:protein phosphatase